MAFHVFRHVEADHRVLLAEDRLGESLGEFRLADAGRSEEQEGGDGTATFAQAGSREAYCVAHGLDGFLLTDDALVEALLHLDQALTLLGREFVDRHACELGHNLRDMFGAYLRRGRAAPAPPTLGRLLQVLVARIVLGLDLGGAVELLARGRIILLALELAHFGLQFLHLHRPGRRRNLHARSRLVDQVDGLVRQEASRDVAVGQLGRRNDGLVCDGDLVVRFEGIAQAAQDHDGLGDRRLGHEDRLEASFQGSVLLDVLLILVERRRAD